MVNLISVNNVIIVIAMLRGGVKEEEFSRNPAESVCN